MHSQSQSAWTLLGAARSQLAHAGGAVAAADKGNGYIINICGEWQGSRQEYFAWISDHTESRCLNVFGPSGTQQTRASLRNIALAVVVVVVVDVGQPLSLVVAHSGHPDPRPSPLLIRSFLSLLKTFAGTSVRELDADLTVSNPCLRCHPPRNNNNNADYLALSLPPRSANSRTNILAA